MLVTALTEINASSTENQDRREEALAELARRYFLSRGPATVQDYAKWSGLTMSDARRGASRKSKTRWVLLHSPGEKLAFELPGPGIRLERFADPME
jgi:hypothetical protein